MLVLVLSRDNKKHSIIFVYFDYFSYYYFIYNHTVPLASFIFHFGKASFSFELQLATIIFLPRLYVGVGSLGYGSDVHRASLCSRPRPQLYHSGIEASEGFMNTRRSKTSAANGIENINICYLVCVFNIGPILYLLMPQKLNSLIFL